MKLYASTLLGVKPLPVEIEADISKGLSIFQIVGLPDAILRESRTRVKSAIIQGGFKFPGDKRVILNLAPSKVRKEGSGFELGLATRILASTQQILLPEDKKLLLLGELALDGHIKVVEGIVALAFAADQIPDLDYLVVPQDLALLVAQKVSIPVISLQHLSELKAPQWWTKVIRPESSSLPDPNPRPASILNPDLSSIQVGKFWADHLALAALGGHHYLVCGPPGTGKTFFAEVLQEILKAMQKHPIFRRSKSCDEEVLQAIYNRSDNELPWAQPHHTASIAGIVGGGNPPQPGAVTQAHGGILFLDELLEFTPKVLDSLREPIEKGEVNIFRSGSRMTFPAKVQVVAATNPCRCGYWKHPFKPCFCGSGQRQQYQSRMSGPFFDRFEVRLFCMPPTYKEEKVKVEKILEGIISAKEFEVSCFKSPWSNHQEVLEDSRWQNIEGFQKQLSHRALLKASRVARTLAILGKSETISANHIKTAVQFQYMKDLS